MLPLNDVALDFFFDSVIQESLSKKVMSSRKRSSSAGAVTAASVRQPSGPFAPSLSIRTIIEGCEHGYICAVASGI
jgi:hypothetical protein